MDRRTAEEIIDLQLAEVTWNKRLEQFAADEQRLERLVADGMVRLKAIKEVYPSLDPQAEHLLYSLPKAADHRPELWSCRQDDVLEFQKPFGGGKYHYKVTRIEPDGQIFGRLCTRGGNPKR